MLSAFFHHIPNSLKGDFDFIDSRRITAADMTFAALAEHASGNDRNRIIFEELCRKLFARHVSRSDIWEHIERASRVRNRQAHINERLIHIVSSLLIADSHSLHFVPAVLQAFNRSILAHNRSADCVVLMELYDLAHQVARSADVADTPARHSKGL